MFKLFSRPAVLSEIVSDVEVDDVLQIGALHADGEGVRRVEGERDQSTRLHTTVF